MQDKPSHVVPHRTWAIAMYLFIAALGMLFASSLVGYFYFRFASERNPPHGFLKLPKLLWLSTAVMLASSVTIHRALRSLRAERQAPFRSSLVATLVLAVAFVAIQAPALTRLLLEHQQFTEQQNIRLYGLVFVLVLVHALHVLGGLVMLIVVVIAASKGRYDHEHVMPISNAAIYWHFLDVVWLVMFISMWTAG